MSRGAVKSPATYDDLLRVPDLLIAEILNGDLYATPRPALPHARSATELAGSLVGPFGRGRGGPGGWRILFEPELHLGSDVVVPDMAGWRRERLPELPAAAFLTVPPDWVAEVISPSTETLDRVAKLAVYARETVGQVWFINPLARTLEVLELGEGRWILLATYANEVVIHAKPFDAIELDLAPLWS